MSEEIRMGVVQHYLAPDEIKRHLILNAGRIGTYEAMKREVESFEASNSGEQATPDEALEAIRSCQALAGTYTVSGSRITHVRIANTHPASSNLPVVADYTIDGDTLTHTVVSGGAAASGSSLTFRRVGSSGVGSPW